MNNNVFGMIFDMDVFATLGLCWSDLGLGWHYNGSPDGPKVDPRWPEKVPRWHASAHFDSLGKGFGLKDV